MNDFNRRRLVQGVLTLIWGLCANVGYPPQGRANVRTAEEEIADGLVGLIHAKPAATRIGFEYLRQQPTEADRPKLIALLIKDVCRQDGSALQPVTARSLKRLFARRQRADFHMGRIVAVQGWRLSLTEARVCALVALTTTSAISLLG